MGLLNRIITTLVLLTLLVTGVALGINPHGVLSWAQDTLTNLEHSLRSIQTARPITFLVGQMVFVLLSVVLPGVLIWWEIRHPGPRAARVSATEGNARARVSTDSIASRLAFHLSQVPDVKAVRPQVRTRGRRVDVQLEVETAPEIEVPMKTEEVIAVVQEVVEQRMGLRLGKLDVRLRHTRLPARSDPTGL